MKKHSIKVLSTILFSTALLVGLGTAQTTSVEASTTKQVQTNNKQQALVGKVAVKGKKVTFVSKGVTYTLTGSTRGIEKLKGTTIQVNGKLSKKVARSFSVNSFKSVKVLKTPAKTVVAKVTTTGVLTYKNVEGGFYSLKTANGSFVLSGDKSKLSKLIGKEVKVVGTTKEGVSSIQMAGKTLTVKEITLVKKEVVNSQFNGILTYKNVEGGFYSLKTAKETFVLSGDKSKMSKLIGKEVKVVGTIKAGMSGIQMAGKTLTVKEITLIKKEEVVISQFNGILTYKDVEGGFYSLKTAKETFVLSGDKAKMSKLIGKEVKVLGTIKEGMSGIQMAGKTLTVKEITPIKEDVVSVQLIGSLKYEDLEGGFYSLTTEEGRFVLSGDKSKFEKMIGNEVQVTGTLQSEAISTIQMSGRVINVKEIVSIQKEVPSIQVAGMLKYEDLEGGFYSLTTEEGRFVLSGDKSRFEKMAGNEVKVTGIFQSEAVSTIQMSGRVINVKEIVSIQKEVPSIQVTGMLKYEDLEGGFYSLTTKEGRFVLSGDKSNFKKMAGNEVRVTGSFQSEEISSIQMSGKKLMVKAIEIVKPPVQILKPLPTIMPKNK